MGPVGETMITYNNLYLELRRSFLQADCPAAGLEARELVCFGGGKTQLFNASGNHGFHIVQLFRCFDP